MVSSKQLLVVVLVALVVLVPVTVVGFLLFPPGFMYDHYSTYSYTTSISTNATVENATVLLPFPAGEDVEGDLDSNLWIYDDDGHRLTDWNPTIVATAHGPMLRLEAGRLVGEDRYVLFTYDENGAFLDRRDIGPEQIPEDMTNRKLVPDPTTYSISWLVEVDHDIETRHPIGNGTFVGPINDVTPTECRYGLEDDDRCSNFTSMTSMAFDATSPATVTIGEIRFEGTNEWGFWLSNSYNSFEARISPAAYADGQQGWTVVDGYLQAAEGRYDGPKR